MATSPGKLAIVWGLWRELLVIRAQMGLVAFGETQTLVLVT